MRTKWERIEIPTKAIVTVDEMKAFFAANPDLPGDAEIAGDSCCGGGPLCVEFHRPWTPEELEAEAARLRQIEIDERPDRRLGF